MTAPQQSKPNEVKDAVRVALQSGYTHIDAAAIYGNEVEVGQGIKESGIDQKDIFVSFPETRHFRARILESGY